jgi:hypothetical protein
MRRLLIVGPLHALLLLYVRSPLRELTFCNQRMFALVISAHLVAARVHEIFRIDGLEVFGKFLFYDLFRRGLSEPSGGGCFRFYHFLTSSRIKCSSAFWNGRNNRAVCFNKRGVVDSGVVARVGTTRGCRKFQFR